MANGTRPSKHYRGTRKSTYSQSTSEHGQLHIGTRWFSTRARGPYRVVTSVSFRKTGDMEIEVTHWSEVTDDITKSTTKKVDAVLDDWQTRQKFKEQAERVITEMKYWAAAARADEPGFVHRY